MAQPGDVGKVGSEVKEVEWTQGQLEGKSPRERQHNQSPSDYQHQSQHEQTPQSALVPKGSQIYEELVTVGIPCKGTEAQHVCSGGASMVGSGGVCTVMAHPPTQAVVTPKGPDIT